MEKVKIKQKNDLPERYRVVANTIREGKHNATLLSDIMVVADIQDRRQAYSIIESLINNYGYPIVASRNGEYKGYYFPSDQREFEEAIKTFESNIKSMKKRHINLINNYNQV